MKALLTAVAAAVGLVVATGGTPAHAQDDNAMVALVHGIPDLVVDVKIGESVVINAFRPGSIADISAFAGRTLENVSLVDDETGETLLGPIEALEIPLVGDWSYVAHLDQNGDPVITPFENDVTSVQSGSSRLTFRHIAVGDAVDLLIDGERPVTNAVNGDSAIVELPNGTLATAQVAPSGEAASVSISSLDLAPGTNTVIYAIGSLTNSELDFVVQVIPLSAAAPTTTTASQAPTTAPETTAPPTTEAEDTSEDTSDAGAGSGTSMPDPTGVATGMPLDGPNSSLLLVTVAGLVLAGGAMAARRRI